MIPNPVSCSPLFSGNQTSCCHSQWSLSLLDARLELVPDDKNYTRCQNKTNIRLETDCIFYVVEKLSAFFTIDGWGLSDPLFWHPEVRSLVAFYSPSNYRVPEKIRLVNPKCSVNLHAQPWRNMRACFDNCSKSSFLIG